jgi:hypothetical protein
LIETSTTVFIIEEKVTEIVANNVGEASLLQTFNQKERKQHGTLNQVGRKRDPHHDLLRLSCQLCGDMISHPVKYLELEAEILKHLYLSHDLWLMCGLPAGYNASHQF